MDKRRVWCGYCGTYVYEDDIFPCVEDDNMPADCGALGAPVEYPPYQNVTVKDDEAVASLYDDPDYDWATLMDFVATQNAQAAHELARDRQVIQNFKTEAQASKALDVQIGGNHYNKLKIQPFEYSLANNLGPAEHTAIKYLTRWKDKGGIKDLDKAIHTIQILKDWAVANGFS